jgi:hypothetical protein
VWGLLALLAPAAACAAEEPTWQEVVDGLRPYSGPSNASVDVSTLRGKVMCGYQGWFAANGDGLGRGWFHYQRGGRFEPGRCSIDLWPDMSELDEDEKYETAFRQGDDSPSYAFSSLNRKTVLRHFQWMQQYGIDGVFVQRFTPRQGDTDQLRHTCTVLGLCREGANLAGRTYAVMYDMHFDARSIDQMRADWRLLVDRMQITADPAYLHHGGRPVISLWGMGFTDRRFDAAATKALLEFLHNDPQYGGLTVMLGVPAWWLTLKSDCRDDPAVHDVLQMADIVSPWSVGRYARMKDVAHHAEIRMRPDMDWCRAYGKDYLPVVFPGFSWHNLRGGDAKQPLDQIPRLKGEFLWSQFVEAKRAGATMTYVAMFDEMDEGTAIFKCTNDPPVGPSPFLTYEGLPSDHYLWLTGLGGRLIRGEIQASEDLPRRTQ